MRKGETTGRLVKTANGAAVADEPALLPRSASAVDLLLGKGDHVICVFVRSRRERSPLTDKFLPQRAVVSRHPHVPTNPAVPSVGHVDRDALARGALQDQVLDVDRSPLREAERGHEPVRVNVTAVAGAVTDETVALAARYALPDFEVPISAADHHFFAVGDVLPWHVVDPRPRSAVDQGSRPVLRHPERGNAVFQGVDRASAHAAGAEVVVLDLPADPEPIGTGDDGVRDATPVGQGNLGLGLQAIPSGSLDDPLLGGLVLGTLGRRRLVRDRQVRGDERSPTAYAPSADEHPGRLAA
ncbi:hypothetical protein FHV95_1333 [Streptomyces coelicolor]|nr:hypothetical protein FHV91_13271 [Streptomyces coelicolor]TYP03120.1 hypothetical protein FHV98_1303 [Streptomyces coelicolor A3(2)]TYP20603.1 hypothetical protein FHV92_13669 [Streptomyces coelicolor]TYP21491.1 hypothetical protein FHV94_1343 [Streptomyces coelicolor]TYP40380.1 hypothetical protein FHV95_1333 [Streptomyces coelicolor]